MWVGSEAYPVTVEAGQFRFPSRDARCERNCTECMHESSDGQTSVSGLERVKGSLKSYRRGERVSFLIEFVGGFPVLSPGTRVACVKGNASRV